MRFERTVHVSAEKPGISGILDLVEMDTKTGRLKPVEYKRGKPKPDPVDEIQLCAQGLCLEEMTGQTPSLRARCGICKPATVSPSCFQTA
ncbi:Dna2/Cas4 domain-containing protein [Neisseria gonorrhoeae]